MSKACQYYLEYKEHEIFLHFLQKGELFGVHRPFMVSIKEFLYAINNPLTMTSVLFCAKVFILLGLKSSINFNPLTKLHHNYQF